MLALQADGLDGGALPRTLGEMAERYVHRIRASQPEGPYRLLGWSVGGTIAHGSRCGSSTSATPVELLCLLDCYPSEQWVDVAEPSQVVALRALLHIAGIDPATLGAGELEPRRGRPPPPGQPQPRSDTSRRRCSTGWWRSC
ncbi:MAG: thioesterase domain-containing protein [Polyangiaceae bacterium]